MVRDKFAVDVRRLLGRNATVPAKTALADRQVRLKGRVHLFQQRSRKMLGIEQDDEVLMDADGGDADAVNTDLDKDGWADIADIEDEGEIDEGDDDLGELWAECAVNAAASPDKTVLLMPSSISQDKLTEMKVQHLAEQELELRRGQASDNLEGLRLALANQALLLRTKVRAADSNSRKTKAWDEVVSARKSIEMNVRGYRRARNAIMVLCQDLSILSLYPEIAHTDLKAADISDERRHGQRSESLPWFWREGAGQAHDDKWMEECKYSVLLP